MGTHQASAVGKHAVKLDQLEGREREALAEGGCSRLNRPASEVGAALQLTRHGPRQIGIGHFIDAEGVQPLPVALAVEVRHGLHHAHVARHLQHRGKINLTMAAVVGIEDRPTADRELTSVVDAAVGIDRLLLQGQGEVDRFEGRARFVEILHRPFTEQAGIEFPVGVGFIGGSGGQGQEFAVAGIQHKGSPALGTPLLDLFGQGLLGHLLKPGVQGELKTEVIAVEGTGRQPIGQGGAVGASPQAETGFLSLQILVTAQLQTRLGLALQIEEAHHVGEEPSLGIHPLGIGLQVEATDTKLADLGCGFGIEVGSQLHTGGTRPDQLDQAGARPGQHHRQLPGHLDRGADQLGGISGEIEVAGVDPEGEAFLIDSHQPPHPVDHGSPFTDRIDGLGLNGTGTGQQTVSIHQLQPGEPASKPGEGCRKEQKNRQQPLGRTGLHRDNPISGGTRTPIVTTAQIGGWAPMRVATSGRPCHQ